MKCEIYVGVFVCLCLCPCVIIPDKMHKDKTSYPTRNNNVRIIITVTILKQVHVISLQKLLLALYW